VAVDAPLTRDLLALLAEAGEAGLLAGDLTDRFAAPGNRVRRNNRINQLLTYQLARGHVLRGPLEQSPNYRRAWTRRWFITKTGLAYLEVLRAGPEGAWYADVRGLLETCTREREFESRRFAALRTVLTGPHPLTVSPAERARGIGALRRAGCDYVVIGAVYGISRERVRQLLKDLPGQEDNPLSLYSSQATE
jgi:hypothetical protein